MYIEIDTNTNKTQALSSPSSMPAPPHPASKKKRKTLILKYGKNTNIIYKNTFLRNIEIVCRRRCIHDVEELGECGKKVKGWENLFIFYGNTVRNEKLRNYLYFI